VTSGRIDVRPAGPAEWEQLAGFFGSSGAYSGCWCTWWRRTAAEFHAGCRDGAAGNRAVLQRITVEGRVPGLLAYDAAAPGADDGARPVGWVSVAPRPEFGRVLRSPTLKPRDDDRGAPDDAAIWAIVCFWVPRSRRGSGVGTALLGAAVDHARAGGARVLEGYPVDTATRMPSAEIYTGTLTMFRRAGFTEVQPPTRGTRRVVRLDLP
jgi:GNAT superfamily N-acetyltransferase